jgi:hypothetical protein
MSNPQHSGSQHDQGPSKEKEGNRQQQQQQPGNEKAGQQGGAPGKQEHQPQQGDGGHKNK